MIDFKNVNKLLGGRDILKDADFRINKGERIGFVGPNGAGKTTITNLLNRFYDIEEGSITIDGVDIKDIEITKSSSDGTNACAIFSLKMPKKQPHQMLMTTIMNVEGVANVEEL